MIRVACRRARRRAVRRGRRVRDAAHLGAGPPRGARPTCAAAAPGRATAAPRRSRRRAGARRRGASPSAGPPRRAGSRPRPAAARRRARACVRGRRSPCAVATRPKHTAAVQAPVRAGRPCAHDRIALVVRVVRASRAPNGGAARIVARARLNLGTSCAPRAGSPATVASCGATVRPAVPRSRSWSLRTPVMAGGAALALGAEAHDAGCSSAPTAAARARRARGPRGRRAVAARGRVGGAGAAGCEVAAEAGGAAPRRRRQPPAVRKSALGAMLVRGRGRRAVQARRS